MVRACEAHADAQKKDRERALEYYNGKMQDMQPDEGRSSVVSHDIRAAHKKLKPSIVRTLLNEASMAKFEPVGPEDEQLAEQATQYFNHVIVGECGVKDAVSDAFDDASIIKTGVLKWSAYPNYCKSIYTYSNLEPERLQELLADEANEVEETENGHTVRRTEKRTDIKLEAVARGSFLIWPDADSIEEAPIVGERQYISRSDLVKRGYDQEMVYQIGAFDKSTDDDADDISRKGDDWTDEKAQLGKSSELVQIYELYVKLDEDQDGVDELYRIIYAENGENDDDQLHIVLDKEEVEEAPYAACKIEREAHQFEGRSLAEDLISIQRIKTHLLRQTVDNVTRSNSPLFGMDPSALTEDGQQAVFNMEPGRPIQVNPGYRVEDAIQHYAIPYTADKTFGLTQYFDEEARERTGVTDQSGGLDAEAFQGMTATSAQLMAESGIAQADMIMRTFADGLRKAFKGVLRLIIQHADKERVVRIGGEWVAFDPRVWNVDMDCSVNIGLGAGSKERDMQVLQVVLGLQREIMGSLGPMNPLVKPDQLYNALAKITETAGFANTDQFFTKPDPEEIRAQQEAAAQQPTPEQLKAQTQIQLAEKQMQFDAQREENQARANIAEKRNEAALKAQLEQQKQQQEQEIEEMNLQLELKKLEQEREMRALEMSLQLQTKGLDMLAGADPGLAGAHYMDMATKVRNAGLENLAGALDEYNANGSPIALALKAKDEQLALMAQQLEEARNDAEMLGSHSTAPVQFERDAKGEIIGVRKGGMTFAPERDERGQMIGLTPQQVQQVAE